jgi:hypothetical protein
MINDQETKFHSSHFVQAETQQTVSMSGDVQTLDISSPDLPRLNFRNARPVLVVDRGPLNARLATQVAVARYGVRASVSEQPIQWEYKRRTAAPSATIGLQGDAIPWRASVDQPWLELSASEGYVPLGPTIRPAGDLPVGVHKATVTVEIPLANVTASISVHAVVKPNVTLATPAITWVVDPFGPAPAPETVRLAGDPVAWRASVVDDWVAVAPTSGVVPEGPVVSYRGPLAAGTHTTHVTIQLPDSGDSFDVPVTAIVGEAFSIYLPRASR